MKTSKKRILSLSLLENIPKLDNELIDIFSGEDISKELQNTINEYKRADKLHSSALEQIVHLKRQQEEIEKANIQNRSFRETQKKRMHLIQNPEQAVNISTFEEKKNEHIRKSYQTIRASYIHIPYEVGLKKASTERKQIYYPRFEQTVK